MVVLAVFLGNPGAAYRRHRHNAGRLLAERLSLPLPGGRPGAFGSLVWTKKFKGLYAPVELSPRGDSAAPPGRAHFLMPETYMNLSGEAAAAAAGFFKIKPEELILVHDELELPLGTVSLKRGGGLGGHNGLRSARQCLGTADFWRLRLGIGRPPGRLPGEGGPPVKGVREGGGGEIARWVLSDFERGEEPALEAVLEAGAQVLAAALTAGPETLLPEWGKKRVIP